MASENERSEHAKGGHNKQNRQNLRQFGLAQKDALLKDLECQLNSPRAHKKHQETIENKASEIQKSKHGPELIKISIIEQGGGRFDIEWKLDLLACHKISNEGLVKNAGYFPG